MKIEIEVPEKVYVDVVQGTKVFDQSIYTASTKAKQNSVAYVLESEYQKLLDRVKELQKCI